MISPELKNKALELRKNGYSYNYISEITHISNATLSLWFSNSNWSKDVLIKNKIKNINESKQRILSMNTARRTNLSNKYKNAQDEAELDFKKHKKDPLFIGSLMLYLGEGDKSTLTGLVRMGNIDSSVLKIFIKFLLTYCDVPIKKIKFWLLSYPDLDSKKCLEHWLKELNLNIDNVYKTQIIQGKHKTKRLLYGVGNIILSNKVLKIKILKWIDLASKELA